MSQQQPEVTRYRLRFGKRGALRWIGHLDLQKGFERLLRRARLSVVHSKGFHPRPKMVFASALPLGNQSDVELMDIWLERPLCSEEIKTRLQAASHPDMPIFEVVQVERKSPALPVLLASARYRVALLPEVDGSSPKTDFIDDAVTRVLDAATLPRERRKKSYDLRPLLLGLSHPCQQSIEMHLTAKEGQTGRAEEVLAELGIDPHGCLVERVELLLEQPMEKGKEDPSGLDDDGAGAVLPEGDDLTGPQ